MKQEWIVYVFTSLDDEEWYEYNLDDWGWDKEEIYKDVVNKKFPYFKWCDKTKFKNWSFVYTNLFNLWKRRETWVYLFKDNNPVN